MGLFDNQSTGLDLSMFMEPNQSMQGPIEASFDFNSLISPEMDEVDFGQSYVPQDLMQQLMGLKMPEMDERGNYGITPTQQREAQFKAMGESLLAAGQGFLTKDPKAFMGMGGAYANKESSILGGYSKANMADVTARLNLGIGQLNAAKGMSDLTQAEVNRRIAEQKYQQEKYKQKGMVGMMKELGGVLNFAVEETAIIDPRRAATVKQAGIMAMKAMENGDISAASEILSSMQGLVPDHVASMLPDMIGLQAANAALKFGATAKEIASMNESFQSQGLNVRIEQGANGQPQVVNANEALNRKLQEQLTRAQINSANANAAQSRATAEYYQSGARGNGGNPLGQAADIQVYSKFTSALSDYVSGDSTTRKNARTELTAFGLPPIDDPSELMAYVRGLQAEKVFLPPDAYMKPGKEGGEPVPSLDVFARYLASDEGSRLRLAIAAMRVKKERQFSELVGTRAKTGATIKR